jgi:hypothetical protein
VLREENGYRPNILTLINFIATATGLAIELFVDLNNIFDF